MTLVDPPMIVTTIPTNERWNQPGTTTVDGVVHHTTSAGKYHNSYDGLLQACFDICVLPNSIQDQRLRRGLLMIGSSYDDAFTGQMTARMYVHTADANLQGLVGGWQPVEGAELTDGTGPFGANIIEGRCFAQRQGEYAYGLMRGTGYSSEATYGYRINRAEFTSSWFVEQIPFYSNQSPTFDVMGQFFVSDDVDPFIWHVRGSFRDLQSGNDDQAGSQVFGFVDDGTTIGTFYFDPDVTGPSPFYNSFGQYISPGTGYHFTGKSGAFRSKYKIPRGQWGYGPYLVHPWRSGNYNPPELWFLIMEFDARGQVTGRFHIYRSTWMQGQYRRYDNDRPEAPLNYQTTIYVDEENYHQKIPNPEKYNYHPDRGRSFEEMPVTLDDDPAYNLGAHTQGGSRFPTLNPKGFGFEHDWFNQAHFVGTIGPFSNLNLYNPTGTPAAQAQNDLHSPAPVGDGQGSFRIMDWQFIRDKKRRGVMHVVASDFHDHTRPLYEVTDQRSLNNNGVWFAQSGDDGATWGRLIQAAGPHGFTEGDDPNLANSVVSLSFLRAERLFEDVTVMSTGYSVANNGGDRVSQSQDRRGEGARNALFVVDYAGSGVGTPKLNPTIFKNGELVRQAWL